MEKKLTPKQKLFVERYLVHKNGLRAAEEAGYKGNYSTLGSIAVENLNKPAIKAAVDAEMAVVTKRNQLDQDWVFKATDGHCWLPGDGCGRAPKWFNQA
jgi:phage terminase small subunit